MNENNTNNQNTEQQPTTPTPEGTGDQDSERTFTQEEVNRIVADRLARERAKLEPSPIDAREADLKARENRLTCREYIAAEGLPDELLDILDTSDAEAFKKTVEKLTGIIQFPSKHQGPRMRVEFGAPLGGGNALNSDAAIRSAFSPPKI